MIVVYSKQDLAGGNIASHLREQGFRETGETFQDHPVCEFGEHKLIRVREKLIEAEKIPFETDYLIFASKHRSEAGKASFTVHGTGNFAGNDFGGEKGTLCLTSAWLIKSLFLEISRSELDYVSTLEVTHHGPTSLKVPMAFIEIGSLEEQWRDEKAGEFIAGCIMNVLKNGLVEARAAIGFGGPHYAPNFSRKILEEDYATSHICPKYNLHAIDEGMIGQMLEKTSEEVELALLDWKGMKGEQRQGISRILDGAGIEHIRI